MVRKTKTEMPGTRHSQLLYLPLPPAAFPCASTGPSPQAAAPGGRACSSAGSTWLQFPLGHIHLLQPGVLHALQRAYLLQHSPLHGLQGNTCSAAVFPKTSWAADEHLPWHLEHLLPLLLWLRYSQDSRAFPPPPSILTASAALALFQMCFHRGITRFSPAVGLLPRWLRVARAQPLALLTPATHAAPPATKPCHLHTAELLSTAAILFVI